MKLSIAVFVILAVVATSHAQLNTFPPSSFFQNILRITAQRMLADPDLPAQYKLRVLQVLYMSSFNFNRCSAWQMPWPWFRDYCVVMTYAQTAYQLRDIYREWQGTMTVVPQGLGAPNFDDLGLEGFPDMTQFLSGLSN